MYNLHLSGNLISYPFNSNQLIFDVLDETVFENLSAIYSEGIALLKIDGNWYGSLQTFEPSKGYWFVSESEFSFEFNSPTSVRDNHVPINNVRTRDDLIVNQSTQQSFFMIENTISNGQDLNSDEVICTYCNGNLVGYRFWNGEYTDVPAMGDDGLFYSENYCQIEDTVTFEILDSQTNNTKPLIILEGNNNWQPGSFNIMRLTDVEYGDVNQNYTINVQDIILVIDHILSSDMVLTSDQIILADVYSDGIINIADIVLIVESIIN
jgi:hypothetical protein